MHALDEACQKTARNYAQTAKSYGQAAHILDRNEPVLAKGREPAFYLLVGFCLELSLKAVLLSEGMSLEEVRDFGHKLIEAFDAAAERRYDPPFDVDSRARRIVKCIAPLHGAPYTLRYTGAETEVLHVPPPQHCVEVMDVLADLAHRLAWR